jgi:hypothetical protein
MTRKVTKRQSFNLAATMASCLKAILAELKTERERLEAKGDTKDRWYARACHLSAQDLQRAVREDAAKQLGTYVGHRNFKIGGLGGVSLLHHCRNFLYTQVSKGTLQVHNFDRPGCSSGARFREAGLEISDSEKRTMANKTKEKPIHLAYKFGSAVCTAVKSEKQLKNLARGGGRRRGRTTTKTSYNIKEVTCPRCKKLAESKVTVVYPDPSGNGVNFKTPEGTSPEIVAEMTLSDVCASSGLPYDDAKRLRGEFVRNSLTIFVKTRK